MARLPDRPNLDHLKKQAKDLLRLYQARNPAAIHRFRVTLPAAADKEDTSIAGLNLKLHDAQSCVAREYGFTSWAALKRNVEVASHPFFAARETAVPAWLNHVYGHKFDRPQPALAARLLAQHPEVGRGDLTLSCAWGDEPAIRKALAEDPANANRTGQAWKCPGCGWMHHAMPPLVAITHSSLLRLPEFGDRLRASARLLLDAGADPNEAMTNEHGPLSALYGAAGKNHDAALTAMLLAAGADPNDGESLYHSTEAFERTCTTLLLEAGARLEGTNALQHQLDRDDAGGLTLLLGHTNDANDRGGTLGSPLLWAIRRRRLLAHVAALLQAGADPHARTEDDVSAYQLALRYGLADVAQALLAAGGGGELSLHDRFVAACALPDRERAALMLSEHPGIVAGLSAQQLQQLPNLMAAGHNDAVRLMVELGWPIAVRGGDWDASALNHAVMRGDAVMTRFLLEHGASWTERHGHDDNANGTLSWSSRNHDAGEGDWAGCAKALIDHGLPLAELDGDYSDEVAELIAAERARSQ